MGRLQGYTEDSRQIPILRSVPLGLKTFESKAASSESHTSKGLDPGAGAAFLDDFGRI